MFKNSKQTVPIAIHMLFARNDQYHNYNTRQSKSLHPSVGRGEAIYRSFSFHGVNIWNYLSKHIPVNVTYIRFNKLTKSFLLNNNIIYRLAFFSFFFSFFFVYCTIIYVNPTHRAFLFAYCYYYYYFFSLLSGDGLFSINIYCVLLYMCLIYSFLHTCIYNALASLC